MPLLWSSPGVVKPGAVDAPVELVDVGTTLLSALGIPRDARMRGDDLGAVLAGHPEAGPKLAFASVEDSHMVTDGRLKVVCSAQRGALSAVRPHRRFRRAHQPRDPAARRRGASPRGARRLLELHSRASKHLP